MANLCKYTQIFFIINTYNGAYKPTESTQYFSSVIGAENVSDNMIKYVSLWDSVNALVTFQM